MISLSDLSKEYIRVRENSLLLCRPLELEDFNLQAMANTSPPKWHLAHTTWFFETFILKSAVPGYAIWQEAYEHLFNSYYNAIGSPFSRPDRGLLSRPTVKEVYHYRRVIDERIMQLLNTPETGQHILQLVELGLHHEQQHQELLLTDLKYSLHVNPIKPVYVEGNARQSISAPFDWIEFDGGIVHIGADENAFCFDNETPVHRQFLEPFSLASRPVTNGEFIEFIEDSGYKRPELWLADGWNAVTTDGWEMPLYWRREGGQWLYYTLCGEKPINSGEPVCHISFYEADAYARWAGARLPTEGEWEHAAGSCAVEGNFLFSGDYHPAPGSSHGEGCQQMFGDVWEWTGSSYLPYPGYKPAAGAIGEYNGKFMCNQMVLRGGSCVSDANHIRPTYRNFFYPEDRWQFSGLRLAISRYLTGEQDGRS